MKASDESKYGETKTFREREREREKERERERDENIQRGK